MGSGESGSRKNKWNAKAPSSDANNAGLSPNSVATNNTISKSASEMVAVLTCGWNGASNSVTKPTPSAAKK